MQDFSRPPVGLCQNYSLKQLGARLVWIWSTTVSHDHASQLQAQAHGGATEEDQHSEAAIAANEMPPPLMTSGPSLSQLPLPPGNFEALHMLYKLLYLEGQLESMGQPEAKNVPSIRSDEHPNFEATLAPTGHDHAVA